MKKKRFAGGGLTQADIDAGLTQADIDVGMRAGKQSSISDAERESAISRANRLDAESIVDKYRDKTKNPDAQSFPVDMGASRLAPRPAPRPTPVRQAPVATRAPRVDPVEMSEEGASAAPGTSRSAPSRGSYDQNGPVGDLIDLIRNKARRGRGNPNPNIYRNAPDAIGAKRGGAVSKMAKKASSASKRADGIATKGKTKGRMV